MRTNDEETVTRLQNQINRLIHSNQVNAVKNEKNGSKKWWSKVNSMTGRKRNTLPVSSIMEPGVKVDGVTTEFLEINRGVPWVTVLEPVMFTIMVNDIKAVNLSNDLSKFADDIAIIQHQFMIAKIQLGMKWKT